MSIKFAIAVIPVALYFILIGLLRFRTRPMVTSGWRDTMTLGIAAAGLVAVGPMQLFTPTQATQTYGAWVWLMLFGFYALALIMLLLSSKPRLIAYGLDAEQFRDVLIEAARGIDPQSHWSRDVLTLPTCGLQLAIEATASPSVQQVVHVGALEKLDQWVRLEREFVRIGGKTSCGRSWAGAMLLVSGALLMIASIVPLVRDPAAALAQLQSFLAR